MAKHQHSFKAKKGYIKAQGDMHEQATVASIGGDATNMNYDPETGKHIGNYPTYDVTSSSEVASVKSHISGDGQITDAQIIAYISDFQHMQGDNRAFERGLHPVEQDAERILALRDQGVPVPTELQNADLAQTTDYLKQHSVLRIPDDHIQAVRDEMVSRAKEYPAIYELPEDISDEQLQSWVNERVQGTGLSAEQTVSQLQTERYDIPANNSASREPAPEQQSESQASEEQEAHGYRYA